MAIDKKKIELVGKSKGPEELTTAEGDHLTFLRVRGANYLLLCAISNCLETILARPISSLAKLSFGDKTSPQDGLRHWGAIVDTLLPLSSQLEEALTNGLKSLDRVKLVNRKFHSLVQATQVANKSTYQQFARALTRSGTRT